MKLDILAFGAHPDDVELSAGGTLAQHVAKGYQVGIADLTPSQLSTRGTVENRAIEAANAAKELGIQMRENLQMRDGFFEVNEEHINQVITVIRRYQPTILMANAPSDRHPDHGRASHLVERAHFMAGLRQIETYDKGVKQEPWRAKALYHYIQFEHLEPDFVVDIRGFVDKKKASLKAYKSQFYDPNNKEPKTLIASKDFWDFLDARNQVMGAMAEIFEAEGFIINKKKIAVNNLFDLVYE